jgi:hypothetical protein
MKALLRFSGIHSAFIQPYQNAGKKLALKNASSNLRSFFSLLNKKKVYWIEDKEDKALSCLEFGATAATDCCYSCERPAI